MDGRAMSISRVENQVMKLVAQSHWRALGPMNQINLVQILLQRT